MNVVDENENYELHVSYIDLLAMGSYRDGKSDYIQLTISQIANPCTPP